MAVPDQVSAPSWNHLCPGHSTSRALIGRTLRDATLKAYEADLKRRLDQLLARDLTHPAGIKLRRMIRKVRPHLFVFVQSRDLESTSNGLEKALRPRTVYRKITNGFRREWGAHLFADIRPVIETARRRSMRAIDAIRLTFKGEPLPPRSQPPSDTVRNYHLKDSYHTVGKNP